jgi:acyl dehydratase
MTDLRYFEDLQVGRRFASEPRLVDAAAIKGFAAEFDPQPFHLDEDQARHSVFAGLAASGWHTAALSMQLCLASDFRPAGSRHRRRADLVEAGAARRCAARRDRGHRNAVIALAAGAGGGEGPDNHAEPAW